MAQATAETYATRLDRTLPVVRDRIARACQAAGREASDVRLVAVTKSHPIEAVVAAIDAGLTDLGENRVEELESKVLEVGRDAATWHMIGHLQSRKAGRAESVADLVHSVDSMKLARKLGAAARENGRVAEVLIQVNTSGEESKSGFDPGRVIEELGEIAEIDAVRVRGLMTMAPFVHDEGVLAAAFERLRRLGEDAHGVGVGPELSMGMTNDLEVAIREGSTVVRIGTALFGERAR